MGTVGRPTKYQEKFCEIVKSIGDEGGSVYEMADACDVALSSLYEWAKESPLFSEAFTRAREKSKASATRFHRNNRLNPDYNPKSSELTFKFMVHLREYAGTVIPGLAEDETYGAQMRSIIQALAKGLITPDEADRISNTVAKAAKIEEMDVLKKELELLKIDIQENLNEEEKPSND